MREKDEGSIRRVLLVDDDPTIQSVGKAILEHCGCRVETAGNGREAVDAFSRGKYDILFMDCHMPEMDGRQAAQEIRALESHERRETGADRVPIVALTGLATAEEREMCLRAGMDDFLGKPFRVAAVQAVLKKWSLARREEGGDKANASASRETPLAAPLWGQAQDGPSVLDRKALDAIASLQTKGADNLLLKVIASYLDSSAALLQRIREAVEAADADALHRAAHTLKTPSAALGALGVSELCRELETMGRSGTLEGARALLARLEGEYGKVRAALERHRAMLRSGTGA